MRISFVVAALAGCLSLGARAQTLPGTWTLKAPMPMAIGEVGVALIDGRIHVVGGSATGRMAQTMHVEYDPAKDTWRWRNPLPRELSHVGVVAGADALYAVGGLSDPTRVHTGAVDNVYAYDPKTDTWRDLPPMKVPRAAVGVAVVDGLLHAIGGRALDKSTLALHEVYNPATNEWREAAPLPRARDHMATIAVDGLIHVIGGRFDEAANNTGLHDIYDPATDKWQQGAPMPTPRSSVAFGLLGREIVVVGGECRDHATYTEAEAYDLATKSWTTLKPPPTGRHAFGAAAFGDTLYFAGGAKGCGGTDNTSDMLALTAP